jgi:hypothetical protein
MAMAVMAYKAANLQSAVYLAQRRLSLIINEMAKQAAQWRGVKAAAKISSAVGEKRKSQ